MRVREVLRTSVLLVPTVRDFTQHEDKSRLFRPGFPLCTLTGRGGHKAALAFTGYDSMRRWRASGYHSIAIPSLRLCALAQQPDIDLLAIDLAGPAPIRLNRNDLDAILEGQATPLGEPLAPSPAGDWGTQRTPAPPRTPTAAHPTRPSLRLREAIEVYGTFRTPANRAALYEHLLSGAFLVQRDYTGQPLLATDERGHNFLPVHTHNNDPELELTAVSALDTVVLAAELGVDGLVLNPREDSVVVWNAELAALRAGGQPDPDFWHTSTNSAPTVRPPADF